VIGPTAASWSHARRCRDDGAFALLAGTAPSGPVGQSDALPAQTAPATGSWGDLPGLSTDYDLTPLPAPTQNVAGSEGKTNREIRRCLGRYATRQLPTGEPGPPRRWERGAEGGGLGGDLAPASGGGVARAAEPPLLGAYERYEREGVALGLSANSAQAATRSTL
jgi:hypothetical protein